MGLGGGGLLRSVGLQRQCVDRAADLRAEDVVDETVLLDTAAPLERRGRDGRAEVIAAAGVVLDLRFRSRNRGLDTLLDLVGRGHYQLQFSRYTLESDDHDQRQGCREGP